MNLLDSTRATQLGIVLALGTAGVLGGCGAKGTPATNDDTTSSSGGSSSKSKSGSSGNTGSSSGSSGGSGTLTGEPGTDGQDASDDATTGDDASGDDGATTSDGAASDDATAASDGAASDDAATATVDAPACVTGQVPTSKVIVLGDSYLDHPAWSNVIPDLYADLRSAGSLGMTATYREYQLGGASMNYGAANLNIPYQYEMSAKMDPAFPNPADIDTIIMDGGGNDVLIDNQGCMTNAQPPPADAACATAIQGSLGRASQLLQEAATDGVKHIIYTFYPHLDPAGGGILPTPAPQVNATLDYAYPLAEQICCGSAFTSSATTYSCSGNVSGTQCVFIDLRPSFEGHVADYIKSDHVHPTDAGAKVIADLIDAAMRTYCIAQ